MAVEITHVRFGGTNRFESDIIAYRWVNHADGGADAADKPTMVRWVDGGGEAYVGTGSLRVKVGVVKPDAGEPFLRTYADGRWTNNLESLPTF